MRNRNVVIYIVAILAILLPVNLTVAQTGHTLDAGIHGDGSGNGDLPFTQIIVGPSNGSVTDSGSGDGNGNTTASASASIHDAGDSTSFYSGSSSVASDRSGNFVPTAEGNSAVIYADTIELTGNPPLPSQIRIHFRAFGTLTTNPVGNFGPQSFSQAGIYLNGVPSIGGIGIDTLVRVPEGFGVSLGQLEFRTDYEDFTLGIQTTDITQSDWDDISIVPTGEFEGDFSYSVPFDQASNSYDFEIRAAISATANDGTAAALASINVTAVTDTDGNPLSNFQVTLASGRILDQQITPGDVNGDGVVNLLDIEPFIVLVSTGEFQAEADVNGDGVVNLLDICPFIELLAG